MSVKSPPVHGLHWCGGSDAVRAGSRVPGDGYDPGGNSIRMLLPRQESDDEDDIDPRAGQFAGCSSRR